MTITFSPETEAWIAERKRKGEDRETKAWLDERKREALLIDPATAEVEWTFGQTLDPYGTIPDLPEELQQVGREYFVRRPGGAIWVHFGDLPDDVCEKLWKHPNAKPSFTVELNGQVIWNIDPPEATSALVPPPPLSEEVCQAIRECRAALAGLSDTQRTTALSELIAIAGPDDGHIPF